MEEQKSNQRFTISEALYLPISIVLAAIIIGGAMIVSQSGLGGIGGPAITEKQSLIQEKATGPEGLPQGAAGRTTLEVSSEDHIRGNPSASVTIVEFSDLQCPFCERFHPTVQQALAEYGDKVRWVYKHFPLDAIHPEARPAAEASECVWEQKGNDGFWQFADGVFENQDRIGSALYRELAQQIGVNMGQFESCVSSRKYQQKVEDDYQQGLAVGVRGTPGNFVNGTPLAGAVPYQTLKAEIDRVLQAQ